MYTKKSDQINYSLFFLDSGYICEYPKKLASLYSHLGSCSLHGFQSERNEQNKIIK